MDPNGELSMETTEGIINMMAVPSQLSKLYLLVLKKGNLQVDQKKNLEVPEKKTEMNMSLNKQ